MVIECKYEDIKNNMDNICEFVRKNCEYSYFNFYSLHYCYMDQKLWLTIPIFLLIGFLCFFILSDTSNLYLSNALTLLSDKLKISQNLAGLTFVAFGNGAPDVISSIVASEDDSEGIDFTIGALMGASVFVTSFVLSTVVLYARSITVEKNLFVRDILMYLFTIAILCGFSYDKKISLWESILFFSLYIIYAIIALIQDKASSQNIPAEIAKDLDIKEEILADDIAHEIEDQKIEGDLKGMENDREEDVENDKNGRISENKRENKSDVLNHLKINGTHVTHSDISIDELLRHDHFYNDRDSKLVDDSNFEEIRRNAKMLKKYPRVINFHLASIKYRIKKHYFEHKET
jgi:Ca2+/Na+ antiporter